MRLLLLKDLPWHCVKDDCSNLWSLLQVVAKKSLLVGYGLSDIMKFFVLG